MISEFFDLGVVKLFFFDWEFCFFNYSFFSFVEEEKKYYLVFDVFCFCVGFCKEELKS